MKKMRKMGRGWKKSGKTPWVPYGDIPIEVFDAAVIRIVRNRF